MPTRHARLCVALRRVRRAHHFLLRGEGIGARGAPYVSGWWSLVCTVALAMSPSVAAQAFYAPPAGLQVSGVPPIPQSLVARAAPYTKFRPSTFLDWHPTRPHALMLMGAADGQEYDQLYLLKNAGALPERLTEHAQVISGATFQPHAGDHVVFRSETSSQGKAQLFHLDVATRKVTPISSATESAEMPTWSARGDRIAFTTVDDAAKLYVGDPRIPGTIKVVATAAEAVWRDARFTPDDNAIVYVVDRPQGDALWRFDVGTGKSTPIAQMDAPSVRFGAPQFATEGKHLLLTAKGQGELRQLVRIELASGKQTPVAMFKNADVAEFAVSTIARRIAVNTTEGGTSVLRFLDMDSGKELLRPALLPGEIVGLRWQSEPRIVDQDAQAGSALRLGFSLATSRAPRELFVYDTKTTKLTRWTNGAVAGLNAFAFAEPARITWKREDAADGRGFLYAPDAETFKGERPVLIRLRPESAIHQPLGFLGSGNYIITEMGVAMLYAEASALRTGDDLAALLGWINAQSALDVNRVIVSGEGAQLKSMFDVSIVARKPIAGVIAYGGIGAASIWPDTALLLMDQRSEGRSPPHAWVVRGANERSAFASRPAQEFLLYVNALFLHRALSSASAR